MTMGFIELFIIGAVIALLVRSRNNGHAIFWIVALGAIFLIVTLGLAGLARYRSLQWHEQAVRAEQAAQSQAVAEHLAQFTSRGLPIPSGYGVASQEVTPQELPHLRSDVPLVFLLGVFLISLLAFTAIRSYRSHVGASGFRGFAGVAVAFLAIMVLAGLFWVRSGPLNTAQVKQNAMQPLDVPSHSYQEVVVELDAAQEPIDELWDRLNAPKIQLTGEPASAGGSPAEQASAAALEAPVATAEVDNDAATLDVDDAADDETRISPNTAPAPQPKPDWVDDPPRLVGAVRRVVVQAGPYSTLPECYRELQREMKRVVKERIYDLASGEMNRSVAMPVDDWLPLGHDYIVRELLIDQHVEDGEASFGLTKTAWGLLEFTEAQDAHLLSAWKSYARREGVAKTAGIAALVLAGLGGVLALLKIDTWTRGYYSKPLFLGVPLAIIGLLFSIALLTDRIW